MGSGACEDQSSKCKDSSPKFAETLDRVGDKEPVELSTVADGNGMASLEPITPVPNREAADSQFDCKSPLSVPNRPAKHSCFDCKTSGKDDPVASIGDSSPKTPRDVVFDPFAPAPDHLAMAPLNKKYINQVRSSVARRLNFESSLLFEEHNKTCSDGVESISDEEIFESVYNNLLEAIVSKQTECFLEEIPNIEWDSDFCKTPPVTRLNGIAETCPGAPKKSSADLHVRKTNSESAFRSSLNVFLENPQEVDPPWNLSSSVHNQFPTEYISDQTSQVVSQLIDLKCEPAGKSGGSRGWYQTWIYIGIPYLVALIQKETLTGSMLETGMVPVLHKDLEIKGYVELEIIVRKGEAGSDPINLY
ncbi:hypothetical protein EZV62_015305 [Acer yangbiense]|uniref:Uncharacterized protein n=1 Tax=Acer yangbiense TaxID=1000413 RepID=A0A5C7HMG2_9ROSI|nr:hypothetical protein EZV62_015305 [Acer yangbiense]